MASLRLLLLLVTLILESLALPSPDAPAPTRIFDLVITWENVTVAGITRPMFLANGQTPGPKLDFDQGDDVEVRVHNQSPSNITIHFHGIEMWRTPWSDGVPGLTQHPTLPGNSFVYRFKATQYGAYWWHSHYRGHIEDGLFGPIIIRPSQDQPTPFHLIDSDEASVQAMTEAALKAETVLVSDLNRLTSDEKFAFALATGIEDICYDAILINGKGRVDCRSEAELTAHINPMMAGDLTLAPNAKLTDKGCLPAAVLYAIGGSAQPANTIIPAGTYSGCSPTDSPLEVLQVTAVDVVGKGGGDAWIALDIIGAINFISPRVTIDGQEMWVYAIDGSFIEPQRVHVFDMFNGERYSVLVKVQAGCDLVLRVIDFSAPQILTGQATLHVGSSSPSPSCPFCPSANDSQPYVDIGGNVVSPNTTILFNQSMAHPFPPAPIPSKADAVYELDMTIVGTSYIWALNTTTADLPAVETMPHPILFFPPNVSRHDNITISSPNNTWIDLIFNSALPLSHAIHKHNNKMHICGSGQGAFNWSSIEEAAKERPDLINLDNPPLRDTFATAAPPVPGMNAWTAVKVHVRNPGAWLLHCHISSHLVGGMMMVLQDGTDVWPVVPDEYLNM